MKKIVSVLMVLMMSMAVFSGCSSEEVENNLAEQLEPADKVEAIGFIQGVPGLLGNSGAASKEDNADDIEAVLDILKKVSSDGEPFEEYMSEGFHKLYKPSIKIQYTSEEVVVIQWEIGTGTLIYNEVEYYIDKEQAQKLYDIFTEYCPYLSGMM